MIRLIKCNDTQEIALDYKTYLKTAHWGNLRLKKAKQKDYKCELCGKTIKNGFNIHHKTYKRLGNERLKDLMFLCSDCHNKLHKNQPLKEESCLTCFYSKLIINIPTNTNVLYCYKKYCVCSNTCNLFLKRKIR